MVRTRLNMSKRMHMYALFERFGPPDPNSCKDACPVSSSRCRQKTRNLRTSLKPDVSTFPLNNFVNNAHNFHQVSAHVH